MSFGIQIKGDAGQLILDDSNSVLHVLGKGSYTVGAGTNNTITVSFPFVVTSQSVPQIFFQLGAYVGAFEILGSSGNWTGMRFYPDIGLSTAVTRSYIISVYNPPASAGGWGARIKNASNDIVFDAGYPCMRFVYATRSYNRSSTQIAATTYRWTWGTNAAYSVSGAAYFLANIFAGTVTDGVAQFDGVYFPNGTAFAGSAVYNCQITGNNGSSPNFIQPFVYAIPSNEV